MGALTESEIFDCMRTNLRLAAEHAVDLAKLPKKGPTYRSFLNEMRLVEGCCRQASAWRSDTRWLPLGLKIAEAAKRAGDWLRGVKGPDGMYRRLPEGQLHPYFLALAQNLEAMIVAADKIQNEKTGRVGMILPNAAPAPHRDTRPVPVHLPAGMAQRSSGLIVPSSATLQ